MPASLARLGVGLATAVLAWAIAPFAALADPPPKPAPLTVVDAETPRKVPFSEQSDGTLRGTLSLVVKNPTEKAARLRIRFLPSDGGAVLKLPTAEGPVLLLDSAGAPATEAPQVRKGRTRVLRFQFELQPDESPANLDGKLALGLEKHGASGAATAISVIGEGHAVSGVSYQPASITIHALSWAGPLAFWLGNAPKQSEPVELTGPGVPTLFEAGQPTPSTAILVRSGDHEAHAELRNLTRVSPLLAKADLNISGQLRRGKYEGKLPLSELAPAEPQLSFALETKDAFVWPLGTVLLGGLASFLVFLYTGLNRRKTVLRSDLRGMLDLYEDKRPETGEPLWKMDWLGPREGWYQTKWNAIPELNPVQGTWSEIAHARNDADLDEDEDYVREIKTRLLRWIKVLEAAAKLRTGLGVEPQSRKNAVWKATRTRRDTRRLLSAIKDAEPADDAAANVLVQRLTLQTTWHEAFAKVWSLCALVEGIPDDRFTEPDRTMLGEVQSELKALDDQSLERERNLETLQELLARLNEAGERLEEFKQRASPEEIAPVRPTAVGQQDLQVTITNLSARAAEAKALPDLVRTQTTPRHDALEGIVKRDLMWTVVIAVITAIAYMAPLYTGTWGSFTDYGTAFAAGFVGKKVFDWASAPVFQSLRLRRKAAAGAPPPSTKPAVASQGS